MPMHTELATWIHQPIHYQQAQHFSQGAVSRCTAPANFSSQNSSIRNCHHSSQPSQQLPRARAPQLHFRAASLENQSERFLSAKNGQNSGFGQ